MKKIISVLIVFTLTISIFAIPSQALIIGFGSSPEDIHINIDTEASWCKDAKDFAVSMGLLTRSVVGREDLGAGWYNVYWDFFDEREITRAEASAIMSRYDWSYATLKSDIYKASTCQAFSDVPDGKWMTPAVQWAADNGIVDGVGGDSFAPNRTITREEFATIMYRYTKFKNIECDTTADLSAYPDGGEVSAWAKDAMAWAVGEGLISGKPGGLLAPQDSITRAEVAVIVYRYNNNVLKHWDMYTGEVL